jgi:AraC-like DNA-binding protein
MKLAIKNMVCNRCILVISQELKKVRLKAIAISLGEVAKEPTQNQLEKFRSNIAALGFELLDDSKKQLTEKIKNIIITEIHHSDKVSKYNFSQILSEQLKRDYCYLSNLFSEVEGITIEKYIINQKVEKVKELLVYGQLTLSEIADKLGYSSVAHLSAHFKNEYTTISKTFSEVEGHSIEKHFILLRLEKVKELISYEELAMVDIAKKLGYSSVQHLSAQFKSICGVSPNAYKATYALKRRGIDKIGQ